jgi:putative transposase
MRRCRLKFGLASGPGCIDNGSLQQYFEMPQSFCSVYLHVVFSTKDRTPWLLESAIRAKVHADLTGFSSIIECPVVAIGGVADHVHLLVRQSQKVSVSDYVRDIKSRSSVVAKTYHSSLREFKWQAGYGAFSVDVGGVERVKAYIAGQEEHHRAKSFKDEFLEILVEHNMKWDERYIWD